MIYITGDTHGTMDTWKLDEEYFKDRNKLTRKDYVIVCGDFGILWTKKLTEQYKKFWKNEPYTVLFCDGNHENFDMLNSYEVSNWNGGKVHKIDDNVIHLMRGQIYDINDKKFFVFGGGTSIDKESRIEGLSWWPEEIANYKEIDEALSNLDKHNNQVDYIITHAAPKTLVKTRMFPGSRLRCPVEDFLDEVYVRTKFKQWFCGHYHLDRSFSSWKVQVLYQYVIKLQRGYPIANKVVI